MKGLFNSDAYSLVNDTQPCGIVLSIISSMRTMSMRMR